MGDTNSNNRVTNKILAVYNTCGISGRENSNYYIAALNTILAQKFDGMKVVMSDCMSPPQVRNKIKQYFGGAISYNFINEVLPVNVTFNHSVLKGIEQFGEFDGYLYIDSGIQLVHDQQLRILYDLLKSGPYGIVSSRVDQDSGYGFVFGFGKFEGDTSEDYKLFEHGDFIIPVGKGVNNHLQIFANTIQKYYKKCWPDIFASWCSESIFTFLCAAIKQKWVISKDVIVHHHQGVDGQSSGFNPQVWKMQGRNTIDHPFLVSSIIKIVQEGQKYGIGYEEAQNIIMHDTTQYDENGYCINDELKKYIKENLFLPQSLLDYDRIKHTWIL